MFPSANYFRDISCPFFSRVSCPRPHCHFKHTQSPLQSTTSSAIQIPSDANDTLNKLINQLSTAATSNSTPSNPTPSLDLTSFLQSALLQGLTSALATALNSTPQPTVNNSDVSEKLTQAISSISSQLSQQQTQTTNNTVEKNASTVPEYRPTPIAELERRRKGDQQKSVRATVKTEEPDFDSDAYVQATFSPPSPSPIPVVQPEPIKATKTATVPKISPSISSNSIADDNHSWVTPPVRRNVSSNHQDFDERKPPLMKKSLSSEKSKPSTKILNKPIATVKQNVPDKTNSKMTTSTNPFLQRIPKQTTPTKVRVMDIDLDRVPVTPTLPLDPDKNKSKKLSSTSLKRSSNGIDEIPPKKPKIVSTATTVGQNLKRTISATNGLYQTNSNDEDNELTLFDQAFPSSKSSEQSTLPKKPISSVLPNPVQQLVSRYSSVTVTPTDSNPSSSSTNHTRAETSSDGRRIAHQPKIHSKVTTTPVTSILQPLVDPNSSVNKIPFKTRQEYLIFFSNELKKSSTTANNLTPTAAISSRAQRIEKEIFDKATNKNSYLNLAAKHLRQLRAEGSSSQPKVEQISPKKTNGPRLVVSHSSMLTSGNMENVGFGIKKSKEVDMKTLTDNELYTLLLVYKACERDLMENGYPAFSLDFPDKVLIKKKNPIYNSTVKLPSSDPNTRICCRCSQTYRINKDEEFIKPQECIYHWGRIRSQRVAGQIEKNYSCCSSKTNSVGCVIGQYHVNDGDDTQLLSGYVKTQPLRKALRPDESYGIFALDCEMCYTINGLELVRVSIINHKLQSVYETLVKPHDQVLDYNTRWSGITEQQLQDCNVTLEDVQSQLLKLFNQKSILIGHSLESDFKALKIVHDTVIDTSLVFPHAKGKPYKRALRTLMAEYLTKIIQENAVGHDSMEDAISCMELMLWKVKQDVRSTASTR